MTSNAQSPEAVLNDVVRWVQCEERDGLCKVHDARWTDRGCSEMAEASDQAFVASMQWAAGQLRAMGHDEAADIVAGWGEEELI